MKRPKNAMDMDQKRRKITSDWQQTREPLAGQDFLEGHALRLQTLLKKGRSISVEEYKEFLKGELDRIEGYGDGLQRHTPAGESRPDENRPERAFLFKTFHEMRNPLHAIMGYSALVLRKTRDQIPLKHQENLAKVVESTDQLKELVDKMVDYYREK
jgi:signal transduction histidine kinase